MLVKSSGIVIAIFTLLLTACAHRPVSDNSIHVTLLHINDVYEITSVSNGQYGGLARLATLRKQLLNRNPNTLTLIGGDFFSPSAMGTAKINGERLAGKQMVSVLNAMGLQYATFGNHEFDLGKDQFYRRMEESKFNWVSSNVFDEQGNRFKDVKQNTVIEFTSNDGQHQFKLALFGLTIDSNKADYVTYLDLFTATKQQLNQLEDKSDFIIAFTHLAINEDETLVKKFPAINLVLGGHEHENYQRWRANQTPILKADANARSAYVVDLYYDPRTGKTRIEPRLVFIDDSFVDDAAVKAVVNQWVKKVFDAFREQGFDPEEIVANVTEDLDGREASVRNQSTNLTRLISQAALQAYKQADVAIYNSGSVRIDDVLPAGKISVYDIIRTLPFGGGIALVNMKGDLLIKVLNQGLANKGSGGYLQSSNTALRKNKWHVKNLLIEPNKQYKVAIADFLLTGKETGLSYLTVENPDISLIDEDKRSDIRQLLIKYMKQHDIQHK